MQQPAEAGAAILDTLAQDKPPARVIAAGPPDSTPSSLEEVRRQVEGS
jgi:hypothetical protein